MWILRGRRASLGGCVLAFVVLGGAVVRADTSQGRGARPPEDFIARHWKAPLPPQGPPPATFTAIEASLAPESCGTCHPAQLADWKTSLHARAMGPGVAGQLADMLHADTASALGCYRCHAPLAEQRPLDRTASGFEKNPVFDGKLEEHGIPCAACHVRRHERFGPPRRDGSLASDAPCESLPHGGVTRAPAFLRAEFCRGCHQFEPGEFALNGTLLENTYNEWKASRYAREGVQCQDCHMPDRRHLWRGIHDPEMVRRGVTITLSPETPRLRVGGSATLRLRVQNTGVGHAFPTYVTPRVVMRAEMIDGDGRLVPGSRAERTIERAVEVDLSRQIRDTRLLPGRSATLDYRRRIDPRAVRLRVLVRVEPDAFYTRFFETVLGARLVEAGAGRGRAQIERALDETRRAPFTIFEREIAIQPR